MGIELVLDMARGAHPERHAIGPRGAGLDFAAISRLALGGAAIVRSHGARSLVFLAVNGPAFPISIMSAAYAGVPIVPLNYRLTVDQLAEQIAELDDPLVIADAAYLPAVEAAGR